MLSYPQEENLKTIPCYSLGMATKKRPPFKTPLPTAKEASERYAFLDKVIRMERDEPVPIPELEAALGMFVMAHFTGWKVLYFLHTARTIKKYESILGIRLKDEFPEFGDDANRTNAYKVIERTSNFWKLVSGEVKPTIEVDKRLLE